MNSRRRFSKSSPGLQPRTLGIAGLIFIFLAAYYAYIASIDPPDSNPISQIVVSLHLMLWWELYVVIVVAVVALYSYRSQDSFAAWLLTFAWGAAVGVNLGGIGITGSPGLGFRILWGAGLGLASAVILGSVSYLLCVWGPKTWGTQSTGTE